MKFIFTLPLLLSLSSCTAAREISGQEDRASIERAIESAVEAESKYFSDCYYSAFSWKTRTSGELIYGWIISKTGRAKSITLIRDSFKAPGLENCISTMISEIQFPAVRNREIIVTKYPFEFEQ